MLADPKATEYVQHIAASKSWLILTSSLQRQHHQARSRLEEVITVLACPNMGPNGTGSKLLGTTVNDRGN